MSNKKNNSMLGISYGNNLLISVLTVFFFKRFYNFKTFYENQLWNSNIVTKPIPKNLKNKTCCGFSNNQKLHMIFNRYHYGITV